METKEVEEAPSCSSSRSLTVGGDNVENVEEKELMIMSRCSANTTKEDDESSNCNLEKSIASIDSGTPRRFPRFIDQMIVSRNYCFSCKLFQFLRPRYGLVLPSLPPVFFSIQGLLLDILTETLDSFQVVFMHVPILMMCCLVLMVYTETGPSRDYRHYPWLLGTGTLQAGNAIFAALAMTQLAVGDALTIFRTSLILVSFFSWVILKEPLRVFDLLFALLAFLGVVFIARPPFIFQNFLDMSSYEITLQGILFALAAASGVALFTVFNRKLSKLHANSLFCIFFNTTMTVLFSGLMSLIMNRWRCPSKKEWFLALLAGVSYSLAQITYFYALTVETATIVIVLNSAQIFYAFLWQFLFLNLPPFWTSYVGAIIIFIACISIAMKNKPPEPEPLKTGSAETYGTTKV